MKDGFRVRSDVKFAVNSLNTTTAQNGSASPLSSISLLKVGCSIRRIGKKFVANLVIGTGSPQMILIFAVIMLLFGANKLPELACSLGKAPGEFKKARIEARKEFMDLEKIEVPNKEIGGIKK